MNRGFRRLTTTVVFGRCSLTRRCDLSFAAARRLRLVRPSLSSYYATSHSHPTAGHSFVDNENWNAHDTMVNDPMYRETVVDPYTVRCSRSVTDKEFHQLIGQDFATRTAGETCDDFRSASVYAAGRDHFFLTDNQFDGLRDRLIAVLPDVSDQQLMSVLETLPLWNLTQGKDPVYFALWSAIDKQCVDRSRQWSLNKTLLFMDHWYMSKLSRLSNFVWIGVRKLARRPSRLTPKQLVQMMFYANTSRKFLPILPMYEIEQEISSYYNDFNIKELGIVSLGFFKTQTPIRNQELIKKLYSSVINEIENINSIDLASFLKIFRYCTNHKNADSMYKLMDVLIDRVNVVKLICCTHMALLGTNLLIKHEDLLTKISQKVVDEISQARIKDLERVTLALTMLNCNPPTTPNIFETIVSELRSEKRNIDFELHPKCYIFTLAYLSINSIFPYDCITKAMSVESLKTICGKKLNKFTIPQNILTLNNNLLIECPDYSGSILPDTLKESCNEHLAWNVPSLDLNAKQHPSERIYSKLYIELLQLFKDESYIHLCYPLPHHPKCDILFCIDTNGKPVIIPETIKSKIALNNFHKPPEIGKWFAILILVRNSVLYYSNQHNGLTLCKIRQLKTLGYEPILFTHKELNEGKEGEIQKSLIKKLKDYDITLN